MRLSPADGWSDVEVGLFHSARVLDKEPSSSLVAELHGNVAAMELRACILQTRGDHSGIAKTLHPEELELQYRTTDVHCTRRPEK